MKVMNWPAMMASIFQLTPKPSKVKRGICGQGPREIVGNGPESTDEHASDNCRSDSNSFCCRARDRDSYSSADARHAEDNPGRYSNKRCGNSKPIRTGKDEVE